ncbi:MAG: signal peptidase II [Gammaproteobacteria bacterium]
MPEPDDAPGPQLKLLWISVLVVVVDQLAKFVAESVLPLRQSVNVLPFFDWYLTYNTGAAFSFLAGAGGWQRWFFTVTAIVISIIIFFWIKKLTPGEKLTAIALCLILGGAIGNLIDRIYLGYVIDYLLVWLGSYPWPAFNFADVAISAGAVILVVSGFSGQNKTAPPEN